MRRPRGLWARQLPGQSAVPGGTRRSHGREWPQDSGPGSSDSGLTSLARPPQRCGRGPGGTRGRLGCRGVCSRCARRGGFGLSRPRVMRAQRQSPRLGSGQGCGGRESPGHTRHSQRVSFPQRLGWALTSAPHVPSGPTGWGRGALLPPVTVGDAGAEAPEATKWGGPGRAPGLYRVGGCRHPARPWPGWDPGH